MLGAGMGKKAFWNPVFTKGIGAHKHLRDITTKETKGMVIYTISPFFARSKDKTGNYIKGL